MMLILMQLSQKPRTLSEVFCLFLKFTLNLECFQKKEDPQN